MTTMDQLRAIRDGVLPPPGIAVTLGFRLTEVEPNRAVFEIDTDRRLYNPMGTLHGGVLCDLGDAAMGCAMATTLAEGETYTTLELKINLFKPVLETRLVATGFVVRRTRATGYVECEIKDSGGSLVAKLASSCLILDGSSAKGRGLTDGLR
jgi:uncharacterized protein (TIGR00369 family)